jgi:hypothetical protein
MHPLDAPIDAAVEEFMNKRQPLIFSLVSTVLILVSLRLPYWTVIMKAPTYPERNLSMRVYPHLYEGDIQEWNVVGNLVGVKVPPPIPEFVFSIVPVVLVAVAALSFIAAFRPGWLKLVMPLPWLVLIALTAFTQYSLYIFGHDLAEDRPLRYVDPFTPPVIGIKKVGSLVTYHLPHVGSALFIAAAIMLFLAYRINKKESIHVESPQSA